MHRYSKLIAINFLVASILVWLAIAYAKWKGIPVDELCMGFRRSRRFPLPASGLPIVMQALIGSAYLTFRHLDKESSNIRVFIGVVSAVFIFISYVLPKMLSVESVWSGADQSYGIHIWLYAAVSNILLALGGRWEDDAT